MTKDESLKLALEALEGFMDGAEAMGWNTKKAQAAITTIKQALEQPEHQPKADIATLPEPVAWAGVDFDIRTTPSKREWVGLTESEIIKCSSISILRFYDAIEAKLKEKNI
jgi:hypothetical protein